MNNKPFFFPKSWIRSVFSCKCQQRFPVIRSLCHKRGGGGEPAIIRLIMSSPLIKLFCTYSVLSVETGLSFKQVETFLRCHVQKCSPVRTASSYLSLLTLQVHERWHKICPVFMKTPRSLLWILWKKEGNQCLSCVFFLRC